MSQSDTAEKRMSRRTVVRTAGVAVTAPAFVNVVTADTDSGQVELETTATVPADTTVEITVFEDTSGDGTADRQQSAEIPDGTTTTEYDLLQSTTAQGDELWLELSLSTNDDEVTPSVDSATLTLPETSETPTPGDGDDGTPIPPPDEPQSVWEIWQNYQAFVAFIVLSYTVIGAWSKSLAVGAFSGYMAFLYLALTSGSALFENIAYVTLILVFLGFAFKLIRLEFEGES